jgi:hypothetical protein
MSKPTRIQESAVRKAADTGEGALVIGERRTRERQDKEVRERICDDMWMMMKSEDRWRMDGVVMNEWMNG